MVKAFEKQIKTIEDQGEKQIKALEKHGKQLVKYSDDKEFLTHSKQKKYFGKLANRRMEEIENLSKKIDLIGFKGPLGFYKNIKEGIITLEKAGEEQKEFKNNINDIVRGKNKTAWKIHAINYIKTLYESREKVIKLFDDYSRIVDQAKCKSKTKY